MQENILGPFLRPYDENIEENPKFWNFKKSVFLYKKSCRIDFFENPKISKILQPQNIRIPCRKTSWDHFYDPTMKISRKTQNFEISKNLFFYIKKVAKIDIFSIQKIQNFSNPKILGLHAGKHPGTISTTLRWKYRGKPKILKSQKIWFFI